MKCNYASNYIEILNKNFQPSQQVNNIKLMIVIVDIVDHSYENKKVVNRFWKESLD